jgi:hypothetical protein
MNDSPPSGIHGYPSLLFPYSKEWRKGFEGVFGRYYRPKTPDVSSPSPNFGEGWGFEKYPQNIKEKIK